MMAKEIDKRISRSLFSIKSYLIFFLLVSFNVTCCLLLFIKELNVELTDIRWSAQITFVNVLFLSLLCCLLDGIRRKRTVERPLKRILQAAKQLTEGDFSVRIEPLHNFRHMNEFDVIIMDFNKMAEELASIETLRTDFIASVSHELKTPLAVIQNYATMLAAPDLTEQDRQNYAQTIAEAASRFSELVENILKLDKLENQQIFPEPTVYDLSEQLRECLLQFEDAWERKQLVIDADLEEVLIRADGELLTLVWNNLFSNAVKFSPRGGRINLTLRQEGGYAVVKVADNGAGMTPEVGRHIFERFYQGDASHATQGNGLGLALVKRVIDIIDGEISVASTLGQGTTFTVKLKIDGP